MTANIITDTFIDTDGIALQNHTPDSGLFSWSREGIVNAEILGNQLSCPNTASIYEYSTTMSVGTDMSLEFKYISGNLGASVMFLRYTDVNNHYAISISSLTIQISKVVGGVGSTIGISLPNTPITNDIYKFEASGNTITVRKNGGIIKTAIDSDLNSGELRFRFSPFLVGLVVDDMNLVATLPIVVNPGTLFAAGSLGSGGASATSASTRTVYDYNRRINEQ